MTARQPRPRVGITTYREPARWGEWDLPADLLPAMYADAVASAGAVPLLLPPACTGDVDELAADTLRALDGLVVAGGADVDPARYDGERHPFTGPPRADRDAWEMALTRAALGSELPLLGVCRGLQVLNTVRGGTLTQHLPDLVGHEGHSPSIGGFGTHAVRVGEGTRLAGILGGSAEYATHHHQGIERLGDGLVACAWAEDGVIEAVELPGRPWVVGVQWHPEAHDGAALFEAFVAACAGTRP